MAARAMSSATVSFGLVSIPVKLYSASESAAEVHFNTLHKKCGSRLKQQYVCPKDDEVVGREDMVKGYEFAKDQYVQFTDEELKALQTKASDAIEIHEFVPAGKLDPIYLDKTYYLGPDKGGDRAYRLLAEAMRKAGRVALAKYASRGKEYLVVVRPYRGGLALQQLHYADEVRSFSEVPLGEGEVKGPELDLAVQLVEQIAAEEFRPEAYADESRKRIQEIIQQKVAGQEITVAPTEAPRAQVIDLMQALKASLARRPEGRAEAVGAARAEPAEAEADAQGRRPAKRAPRRAAADVAKAK
jgi:DNA end-binding protein Ku